MATFTKRGDRQWRARVRRQGHPVQTATFDTKFDAETWARGIEGQIDRGAFHDHKAAMALTLGQALERWRKEDLPRSARSTQATETRRVEGLLSRAICNRPLALVRSTDVAAFIREREAEKRKPDTIRLDLAIIRHVYVVAKSSWGMDGLHNPVVDAKTSLPKGSSGRTRRPSSDEQTALLNLAPPIMKAVIELAISTAMRRSELATLSWPQINFEKRTLVLHDTKNKDSRTVPLSKRAISTLTNMSPKDKGSVFSLDVDQISKGFRKITEAAGIIDLRFHDLRHEAVSQLFEKTNLDAIEIAKITGHKSMQMLYRYTHLRSERLVDRLG